MRAADTELSGTCELLVVVVRQSAADYPGGKDALTTRASQQLQ
jgi:hypothetical protein